MQKKRILFTGGGTAGHVTVNLALIPYFLEQGWHVDYIGSYYGIERELITPLKEVTYYPVSTGKLRRYMSLENIKDPFKVLKGTFQSWRIIRKNKPNIVFSKGGFVSVPVVMAARFARVPTIIHESDVTPGLANKIAAPFAKKMVTTFPETVDFIGKEKATHVGAIVREELLQGDRDKGHRLTNLRQDKRTLLIMGGSSGSQKINDIVRKNLPTLLERFNIIHICGWDNVDHALNKPGYVQFEYVKDDLKHLFAITDLVVSRAGANAIFEFLALKIPMLLIPLSLAASRGDQIDNAKSFKKLGYAHVMFEEDINDETFVEAIQTLDKERKQLKEKMLAYSSDRAREEVITLIEQMAKK